ncbi:unnamed protein product [Nezara viridula]|uniref:Uncharacterized protein n=1 Tax=Nezara viridula TaxID=85310 RepID=A0A9P0MSF3_NEZVI|nr:unnamed protein product [Nezara viridula]
MRSSYPPHGITEQCSRFKPRSYQGFPANNIQLCDIHYLRASDLTERIGFIPWPEVEKGKPAAVGSFPLEPIWPEMVETSPGPFIMGLLCSLLYLLSTLFRAS